VGMEDEDEPAVAIDFYGEPGNTSTRALNLATQVMRKRHIAIDRWIKLVHDEIPTTIQYIV
jgi:hypothetical protein